VLPSPEASNVRVLFARSSVTYRISSLLDLDSLVIEQRQLLAAGKLPAAHVCATASRMQGRLEARSSLGGRTRHRRGLGISGLFWPDFLSRHGTDVVASDLGFRDRGRLDVAVAKLRQHANRRRRDRSESRKIARKGLED
jgi:hypothetical protein